MIDRFENLGRRKTKWRERGRTIFFLLLFLVRVVVSLSPPVHLESGDINQNARHGNVESVGAYESLIQRRTTPFRGRERRKRGKRRRGRRKERRKRGGAERETEVAKKEEQKEKGERKRERERAGE